MENYKRKKQGKIQMRFAYVIMLLSILLLIGTCSVLVFQRSKWNNFTSEDHKKMLLSYMIVVAVAGGLETFALFLPKCD
jgi:hypothetical protein